MTRGPANSSPEDYTFPSDSLAWKMIRAGGISFKCAAACFQDGIELAGDSLELVQNIHELTDHGRSDVLLMADFNMTPS